MNKRISKSSLYDYSGVNERQDTIAFLFDFARQSRQNTDLYWKKMHRYYDGKHDITATCDNFSSENSLPFLPAQSTDGYIHVETQIQPTVPDFEFCPRDKTDFDKAKQREKIVKYICDNNDLDYKNSRNERQLNIKGSAVWKVCWNGEIRLGADKGDVSVLSPRPEEIYPDPTAKDVDGCEYIGYVYKMHKQRAQRVFGKDFKRRGETLEDYLDLSSSWATSFEYATSEYSPDDDTVTVTEWWFRQPADGSIKVNDADGTKHYSWKSGDIALSVLINGKEVRYIPKYWKNTGFEGFPFVIYSRIPSDTSIWGKSELEAIIPLIDAKDRELTYAQLNSAFSSNDIVLIEENALSDGELLDNSPGSVWKLRPGMMGKVARLGNMASAQGSLYTNSAYWQSLIESTTGNFEVNQGKEPSNVTTATGIALLGERAQSRKNLKNIDRNAGFKRLYSLIDMTSLEHYNDGRIIRLGLSEDEQFTYKFGGFTRKTRETKYIPSVDVTIHTGSSIANSKAFTVSALSSLISMNINADNYKLVKAYVENIGIPERAEICEYLDKRFGKDGEKEITAQEIMEIIEKTVTDTEEEYDR